MANPRDASGVQNGLVHRAKKPLGVDVHFIFFPAVAVAHGTAQARAAVRGDRLMRFGQLIAQRFGDGARHIRRQLNFIECVAVALKQFDLVSAQTKHLKAIRRLQKSSQRFGVEAIGDDGQLRDGPLQGIHLKQSGRAEDGDAIERVVPEIAVASQFFKRLQQRMNFVRRIFCFE